MIEDTYTHLIRSTRPRAGPVDSMTTDEAGTMDRHFAYLQRLQEEHRLVLAGPCLDGAFGEVIGRAASDEGARALMENDPAVHAGIMQSELHRFRISLS